jgi:hypothetical protein
MNKEIQHRLTVISRDNFTLQQELNAERKKNRILEEGLNTCFYFLVLSFFFYVYHFEKLYNIIFHYFIEKQSNIALLNQHVQIIKNRDETIDKCKKEHAKDIMIYQEDVKRLTECNDTLESKLQSIIETEQKKEKQQKEQLTIQEKEILCQNDILVKENNNNNDNKENSNSSIHFETDSNNVNSEMSRDNDDENDINESLSKISKYTNKRIRQDDDDEEFVISDEKVSLGDILLDQGDIQSRSESDDSHLEKSKKNIQKLTLPSSITRIVSPSTDSNLLDTHSNDYIGIYGDKNNHSVAIEINSDSDCNSSSTSSNSSNNNDGKKKQKIYNVENPLDISESFENFEESTMTRSGRKRRQTRFYSHQAIDRLFFVAKEIINEKEE